MSEESRPIGGRDYPRTYQEFRSWFPDDAACVEYLGKLRWPDGFSYPRCGDGHSWRTDRGLWMCAGCGLKTSATAGTIFHSFTHPAIDLVRGSVVRDIAEERGLGQGSPRRPRVRFV